MFDFDKHLADLAQQTVLVVGDLMLDEFVYGEVSRISPEAPTPVIAVKRTEIMIGGAGNVARNLVALGTRCVFVGVVGDDDAGRALREALTMHPLIDFHLVVDPARQTTRKVRFVSEHHSTHMLRADWEMASSVDAASENALIGHVIEAMPRVGAVVLSDYAKGALTPRVIRAVIDAANKLGKPVVVDPKGRDYGIYRGATVITPNRQELADATHSVAQTDDQVVAAAAELGRALGTQAVLVTRSEAGMTLVGAAGGPSRRMARPRPAGRLHQWLLRSAASRPRQTAGGCALGLRPPGGGIERRCIGHAAQRRGPAGAAGHGARRGAGRARSGRPRRRVRRGHPGKADRTRKADGIGQRRRLHPRA